MQTAMSLKTIACAVLIFSPRVEVAAKSVFSFRHSSAKPFLDGDFTRDSSNPLDVYEDMDIKAKVGGKSAGKGAGKGGGMDQGKAEEGGAGKGEAPAKGGDNATKNDDGKGKGESKNEDKGAASAVQMKKIAALRQPADKGSEAKAVAAKKEETPAANATAQPASAKSVETNLSSTMVPRKNSSTAPVVNASEAKTEVPAAHTKVAKATGCVTRADPRVASFWIQTADEGSTCIFGLDARDEGSHCVPEMEFGSNGWCYTEKDLTAWGSCSQDCPLYGPHAKLASKIDGVANAVGQVLSKVDELVKNMGPSKVAEVKESVNATEA